jgi:thiol:disulfide interchange protein
MRTALFLLFFACSLAQAQSVAGSVDRYDPSRDAVRDLNAAVAVAKKEHKRILLDVGGDWCSDCRLLDVFLGNNSALVAQRDQRYVWVKVYYGRENKNEKILGRYPRIEWYPTLLVLDENGALLHLEDTRDLLEGKEFSSAKFAQFLDRWRVQG